jgi:hypothetical protein
MAVAPQTFFRYLADNSELVMTIFDRVTVDESELQALIRRYRSETQPAVEHLRRQVEDLGIVERTAHADASFELSQAVVELLSWLTRRQRLSSATVLGAYLDDIGAVGRALADAVKNGDSSAAAVALRELDGNIEKVRLLSEGNRESVVTEAQTLRAVTGNVSAVDRFTTVRRLWERYLQPLRQLVSVQGEMEQLLARVKETLNEGERRFLAHGAVQQGFTRTAARLARMQRTAADDHHAAVTEVAPLYDQLRRDSRWLVGASTALAKIRAQGAGCMRLDQRLGLTGWRTRYLVSDDKLRARFASLVGYAAAPPAPIAEAPPPPDLPLITEAHLRTLLAEAAPIEDALAFILNRWPAHPLTAQLRAFGLVTGGAFGPIHVSVDDGPRNYPVDRGRIEAWPVALPKVMT